MLQFHKKKYLNSEVKLTYFLNRLYTHKKLKDFFSIRFYGNGSVPNEKIASG